jgi:20S proteasome alpha/beta subunit
MTVCIAAVCNIGPEPLGTAIVAAADRMITIGELEYEPEQTKIVELAGQTIALCAGDMQLHAVVVPKVRKLVRDALHENPANINVSDIAEMYAREFAYYRRTLAERQILVPRGLDFDRFLARQSTMAHYQVRDLDDSLAAYYIDSTAIIAGLDPSGGHLYKITNPGIAHCWDTPFFACTGSGEALASTQFMVAGYEKRWSLARALWLAFSAKARAETAGGVGEKTDVVIVRYGGNISAASDDEKKRLYELFHEVEKKEKAAAQEAEAEVDAYLRELEKRQPARGTAGQQTGAIERQPQAADATEPSACAPPDDASPKERPPDRLPS